MQGEPGPEPMFGPDESPKCRLFRRLAEDIHRPEYLDELIGLFSSVENQPQSEAGASVNTSRRLAYQEHRNCRLCPSRYPSVAD
jgi:hypothetical protein